MRDYEDRPPPPMAPEYRRKHPTKIEFERIGDTDFYLLAIYRQQYIYQPQPSARGWVYEMVLEYELKAPRRYRVTAARAKQISRSFKASDSWWRVKTAP